MEWIRICTNIVCTCAHAPLVLWTMFPLQPSLSSDYCEHEHLLLKTFCLLFSHVYNQERWTWQFLVLSPCHTQENLYANTGPNGNRPHPRLHHSSAHPCPWWDHFWSGRTRDTNRRWTARVQTLALPVRAHVRVHFSSDMSYNTSG